ncbi:MAG: monovalent cation/H+ antiporter complex subunit F [Oscillospiraceae bacterium]|jgi:multicomponent Na+:H+ antiporter subunit F|nr:monovalent cation/H+ antiporter complex subunit F [Oscillospiraceae bacterium]MDY4191766.1 monovalent cation/H+ antiporter complex subunit F [Oscillospiraceae bacterium]
MFEPNSFTDGLFLTAILVLAVTIVCCLVRAIRGPRFTDRIVAVNMIGTMTIMVVCLLSVYYNESFLVDIAIIYAMLSFIAVVVLCRLVMTRRRVHEMEEKARKEEEEKKQ